MRKNILNTVILFLVMCIGLFSLCSCGGETEIVGKTAYIEIQVDNSEQTGELSYTEPLEIRDDQAIEDLRKIVNSAEKYTEDEFLDFESCPIVTFYLVGGHKLALVASDYKGIFYISVNPPYFSDKTLYILDDGFELASHIQNLYEKNLDK